MAGARNFLKAEPTVRPPNENQPGKCSLRPALLVTIQNFAFRHQPVVRLASERGPALLVELERTTTDFFLQAERHHAGPLHNFRPGLGLGLATSSARTPRPAGASAG